MRHTDPGSLPDAALPDGVRIRRFMPGHDEDALLRVNAAAFADHPEQGRLDLNDLRARMAEEWFDPAGLLMAWEDGELLGFHWTKVPLRDGAPGPVGEVYVVGVSPDAQGRGLGKQLTLAGVQHMASQGRTEIILYVDAANAPAVGLYRRLGFEVFKTDTQYAPAGTFEGEPSGGPGSIAAAHAIRSPTPQCVALRRRHSGGGPRGRCAHLAPASGTAPGAAHPSPPLRRLVVPQGQARRG